MDSLARGEAETPTLIGHIKGRTSAASSCVSSSSALSVSREARWTPFQDRVDATGREITSADNTLVEGSSLTDSQQARKKLGFEGLFDATDPDVEDVDDVVGLCSGKFVTQAAETTPVSPATQVPQMCLSSVAGPTTQPGIESQDTVILGSDSSRPGSSLSDGVNRAVTSLDKMLGLDTVSEHEEEEEEGARIVMSDDEAARAAPGFMEDDLGVIDSGDDEGGVGRKKRRRKKRRRILSDSEDDNVGESDGVKEISEEEEAEEEGVEYDSDENPIPKKDNFAGLFTKKGKLKNDFVEGEAELSGSEDDVSDDEDEKELDKLEMEEGDLDDIDEDQVRSQVGRIHQKVVLDEDQAEIRLFQERFLEDGEDHDDQKRQRQFKWKGLDDDIELERRASDNEDDGEAESELAEKCRRERMEREAWLMENKKKSSREDDEGDEEEDGSQFMRTAAKVLTRMNSKKDKSEEIEEKKTSEEAIAKVFKSPKSKVGPLRPLQLLKTNSGQRGSFLARGEASLKRLAERHRATDDGAKTGSVAAKASRNFVFHRVSPAKENAADGAKSAGKRGPGGGQGGGPAVKRARLDRTLDEKNRPGTIFNLL